MLALRVILGVIFLYHGYPKLVHPTQAMHDFFVSHGFPAYFLSVAGILEVFGGLLLIVGLFTRSAALLLAVEMAIAIWRVHSTHGIMAVKDYEFPLALAGANFALATIGAGLLSLDNLVFGEATRKRRPVKSPKD